MSSGECAIVTVEVKWRNEIHAIEATMNTTLDDIKRVLQEKTSVACDVQRFLGIGAGAASKDGTSNLSLFTSKIKHNRLKITMLGTPSHELNSMEADKPAQSNVLNDFSYTVAPGTTEYEALKDFSDKLTINFIQQPRPGCKLLVLDLDHTLLHFSSKQQVTSQDMKRPHLDLFLSIIYQHYDIAIWSQTHWRWLEIKLIELGMLSHTQYKICFVLDKENMFRIGKEYVKPLHIIWTKCGHLWGPHNTLHVDDISRNFLLNKGNGIVVTPFYREKPTKPKVAEVAATPDEDAELLLLSR